MALVSRAPNAQNGAPTSLRSALRVGTGFPAAIQPTVDRMPIRVHAGYPQTTHCARIGILFDAIQICIRPVLTQDQFLCPAVAIGLKDDPRVTALKHIIPSAFRR